MKFQTIFTSDQQLKPAKNCFPGTAETYFDMDGIRVNLIDVGGERSERKRWLHCFESVDAVIFVAALTEYDQVCIFDANDSRLRILTALVNRLNTYWQGLNLPFRLVTFCFGRKAICWMFERCWLRLAFMSVGDPNESNKGES